MVLALHQLGSAVPVAYGPVGLADFERRLERGVEGVFGRVFRSSVRPVELGRKLVREMDVHRTVSVSGATMAPNDFTIVLADADYAQFADMADTLEAELVDAARTHANQERYSLAGPVEVAFEIDDAFRPGAVTIEAKYKQAAAGTVLAHLVLQGGQRIPLSTSVVTIGRQSDCNVVLGDHNASRRHAEIRPVDGGYVLVDLASTNGTRVNGVNISQHQLHPGDEIAFGATTLVFEQD